jgi:hypothetical protein
MLSRTINKNSLRFVAAIITLLGTLLTLQPSSFARDQDTKDQDMSVIARASSGPLACEIRKVGVGESVQLTGVVSSSAAVTGNARFLLTKSGPSGTSNVNQGNAFDLAAGAEMHVSHVTINLGREDHALVEFVATSSDGILCHATADLKF